ncbi:MAG: hypothetical protein F4Y84_18770 [Caldilineaceae bacterium SB0665_bin_25]|nr:hypothetical protein [Caldilineaceae bacterium SB0665_bin_25]
MTTALSPDTALQGTNIIATLSFHNLISGSAGSLNYRADVTSAIDGSNADVCEGAGLGGELSVNRIEEGTAVAAGAVSPSCPSGSYRLHARLWDSTGIELTSASVDFTVIPADAGRQDPDGDLAASQAPALPAPELTVQATADAVELSWSAVSGAARYALWAWESSTRWQQIGGNNLTATTHTHRNLTAGTLYFYTVQGLTAGGEEGAWSAQIPTVPGGWLGEYYASPDLTGARAIAAGSVDLNFNWGSGSPYTQLSQDGFSVRWTRSVSFDQSGVYRFTLGTSDVARVWLDSRLIFELRRDVSSRGAIHVEVPVTAGTHAMRVEYRDESGNASIEFGWTRSGPLPTATPTATGTATATPTATTVPPLQDFSGWKGEYFNNRDLHGDPVLVRNDADIDFNWRRSSPADGIPAENFSVRWTRIVTFTDGLYRFSVRKDDGARVWVDGQLLIDHWHPDDGSRTYNAEVSLPAGAHKIKVEYSEWGNDAQIRFQWERRGPLPAATATPTMTPTPTATPRLEEYSNWRVEYFANQDLAGAPAGVRSENGNDIDHDYRDGGPYGLPRDHYSLRWERIVTLDGGLYRFILRKDDGARVWVDGQLILDHWDDCCYDHTYTADLPLIAGDHTIRVEHYENEGEARINFRWERRGALPGPTATPEPAVWSTTLTVGSSGGYFGYRAGGSGALSDNDFSWQGTSYSVEAILHDSFSDGVSIELSADIGAERDGLALCLGTTRLSFADARGPNDRQFFWDDVDPGWSAGSTVSVSLNNCGG